MLYIFDSAEKLITTLPKGSFFDAVHYEVLNGENTFKFTVPAGNEYVVEGNLVAFRDLDSYWQIFEIKRIVDVHGDGLTRTAYCEHIFYELLDDIVTDKRPSAGATAALSGMLENTRWQAGIVDDLGASSTSAYYEPALSAVQKVADAWKGELHWRCVINGGVITRYVDLRAMVGTDTGKQFVYSKDILNIEREVDSSSVVTALYGRGKGIELESGSYGRRLTFANVVAADKPAGQEWIGDDDALSRWGRNGRHRFDVFIDEEETDPAKLLQKTRDELDRRKVPRVTYRLDVVSLEELTGYEHEAVRLGDLVRVIDREFKPELVVSARVIEIERDVLDPANTKVVLGSFAPTIVEATINTARRVDQMANRPYNTKWLDGKISVLQNAIENTQSYVFQTADDGILILDAADYATATKAMKLGGGIFAIANQKDGQGGWNWRTFGDGSGFTADLITAGIIDAGLVQIGPQTTFAPGYDPVDNHVYFQYSANGTSWHDTFNPATDKYMRQKVGDSGTWSDPMRVVGEDGPTGPAGQDGTPGAPGQDGTSSYLWIRYSQQPNGNPMTTDPTGAKYIGVATTTTASAPSSYASYSWSLIKGTDGIKGEKGDDGQTSYLHIKYSDDGVNFTANNGEDVGAWIGTYVDFNPVDSTTFSDYTWNKVRGTPIVWKGDLASPPSNPEENWVYRDTDNGYVYIYNGTVWELMVTDGADGIDGAPGVDGMSVYITYHNNPTDSQPATPTGDGTSGGWYTAPSAQANWMSQKVATNAYSGTWGAPILISGGRKFTSQPVPPYDVGDLWIGGSDGQNTLICTTARSSGSFVASDWERMTEPVANMGVDADCLGLWHFDGSLNSHKGITAITALDLIFDAGCFGSALKPVGIGTPTWTNVVGCSVGGDNTLSKTTATAAWDAGAISQQSISGDGYVSTVVAETNTHRMIGLGNANVDNHFADIEFAIFLTANGTVEVYESGVQKWTGGTYTTGDILKVAVESGVVKYYKNSTLLYTSVVSPTFPLYVDTSLHTQGATLKQVKVYPTIQTLKVPTTGLTASQGTINFRAKNLSASTNGSVLIDLPDNVGNQGIFCGIADDGKLFIEDAKLQFQAVETSQADFNTGTLSDVQATSAGNVELARDGTDFSYAETSQADFESGTLTDVEATGDGDLELVKDIDSYTKLLLHMDGSDNGTTFTDECGKTVTRSGAVTKTGVKKFGTASGYFDGTGDYLSLADSDDWCFGSGDFTIDFWMYLTNLNGNPSRIISQAVDGNHYWAVDITNAGAMLFYDYNNAYNFSYSFTPTSLLGVWHHIAVVRYGNTLLIFIDGASQTLTVNTTISGKTHTDYNAPLAIGAYALNPTTTCLNGYIDELRISKGIARWTSNFTPPSAPYGGYESSGTRVKEVDISGAVATGGTKIEWSKTTPANTAVKVETALSTDGGTTYGSYSEATSGSSIPGISAGTNLSNAKLKIKETLSTTDTSVTPQLHSLNFDIYASYKSSGYRYKVYDISAVGSVGSSKITWTENKPASTTLTVKAAISTDGGSTYSSWQACTSGQAIPGLTQGMDISNARLKVQEDLATSDGTKTPQLQILSIEVNSNVKTAYGVNKSTLTAWDSISLAYKSDRLSLVVNDTEACYIENPGLPTALGSHIFIGTDRNGNNAINTLVDELRIDKVYRDVNIRTGWHKTGVPFYTSEDMKQWPGYLRAETDGLKVYDSSNALRVLIGSWLRDAVRKYGIKIIEGEMYSGIIRTGGESDTTYIQLISPNLLQVFANGKKQLEIDTEVGGRIQFFRDGTYTGDVRGTGDGNIFIYSANKIWLLGRTGVDVQYGINVTGGTKNCIEDTIYGKLAISARESPEVRYIDEGMGTLVNGECRIDVDPIFMECIEPHTPDSRWYVNLTPYGKAILYVDEIGDGYFVVKDYNGNANGIEFTWSLSATRKDYALIRFMEVLD